MSTISSLYPTGSYLSGKSFDIEVTMQVPDGSYSVVIDRVDLIGNQIFVLSSVEKDNKASAQCKINVFIKQLTVKIPKNLDDLDLKVNIYMIHLTSPWHNSFYENNFAFVQSEASYIRALKEVEAYENSYCQLF